MFHRTLDVLKKIKKNRLVWTYNRTMLELRIPSTSLGKKIIAVNRTIYHVFNFFKTLALKCFKPEMILMNNTLCVFYDLEVSPITFNFCETLSMANLHRKKLGLDYLYVVFVPGPQHGIRQESLDYEAVVDINARHWRKRNILFSLTSLVPACIGFSNCASRQEADFIRVRMSHHVYPIGYSTMFPLHVSFYDAARSAALEAMPIEATAQSLKYLNQWLHANGSEKKLIVITLRQYAYMTDRNSNIKAWSRFCGSLDPEIYFVVIVLDTDMAMEKLLPELSAFFHFTEACWNIELRAALYESAYLNLGINTGPFSLCWLNNNCRYILFKIITESVPQTTEEAQLKHGFIPGRAPPFAQKYQQWVWEDDTEEVIMREFKRMNELLE